jgi:hypothetical protein
MVDGQVGRFGEVFSTIIGDRTRAVDGNIMTHISQQLSHNWVMGTWKCAGREITHLYHKRINWVKQPKLLRTITFILELGFRITNSHWKGIEE